MLQFDIRKCLFLFELSGEKITLMLKDIVFFKQKLIQVGIEVSNAFKLQLINLFDMDIDDNRKKQTSLARK